MALERQQPDVPDVLSLLMLLSSELGWMGQGREALMMSAGCPGDLPPPITTEQPVQSVVRLFVQHQFFGYFLRTVRPWSF